MSHTFEELPDLPLSSPEYQAHRETISTILSEVNRQRGLISRVNGQAGARSIIDGRKHFIPSIDAIHKETHVNCMGLQILLHNYGMEAYRREYDDKIEAELRPLLRDILSVRLSIANFDILKQPSSYVSQIEKLDEEVAVVAPPSVEVPSLTPYLFRPQTAIKQFKNIAGSEKFSPKHTETLLTLGEMFAYDDHVLHSLCLSLVQSGQADGVEMLLRDRAAQAFPAFGRTALTPFLQTRPDLFVMLIIALVESNKTKEALGWCDNSFFQKHLTTNEKVAEKYAAALRHQGAFKEAVEFIRTAQDKHGMKGKPLQLQYEMAIGRETSVLKKSPFERPES